MNKREIAALVRREITLAGRTRIPDDLLRSWVDDLARLDPDRSRLEAALVAARISSEAANRPFTSAAAVIAYRQLRPEKRERQEPIAWTAPPWAGTLPQRALVRRLRPELEVEDAWRDLATCAAGSAGRLYREWMNEASP
jgi:hypothetical protein